MSDAGPYQSSNSPSPGETNALFLAFVQTSHEDVIGDNTVYTIVYNDEVISNANYDSTTGIFTADKTGTYIFGTNICLETVEIADLDLSAWFLVNSNNIYISTMNPYPVIDSNERYIFNGTVTIPLAEGDQVSVQITCPSTSTPMKTIGILGTGGESPLFFTWFYGIYWSI